MCRSTKAHILLVLVTLVWGATFVMIKNALRDVSPLLFNALRMTLAAVAMVIIFLPKMRGITREVWKAGALVGVFLWIGYDFQTPGLRLTTPSKSAFITGLAVVLVPLFLALFWHGRVNRWTLAGVVSAFAGLYLMTVPASGDGLWSGVNEGDLLTLGCAVGFALQLIFLGRATRRYPFEQVATVQALACAALMWVTIPALERPYITFSAQVWTAIAVTGILCTAVAFTIQAWAQQFTPPTHTALIFSLEPVFAWMASYVLLGERLGLRAGIGALLILAGVLVSELLGRGEGEESALSG